ncbi:hypothetical protein VKT23_010278 [Stygiomarasmius scandens]|uniref:CHAT domain-containing protein n=1 Tax=Marasmiellus scandens TaxID=2682957 RepID=A0ABR1JC59_9AGAR
MLGAGTLERCHVTLILIPCTQYPDVAVKYEDIVLNVKKAVERHKQVLPKQAEFAAPYLIVLARLRHLCFILGRNLDYLIHALSDTKQCLRVPGIDDYHKALYRVELGMLNHSSFHYFGANVDSNQDFEEALRNIELAISLAKDGPRALYPYLHRERGSLILCHYRCGLAADALDLAVEYLRLGVESTCVQDARDLDTQALGSCLNLLTIALVSRYNSAHNRPDLDDAIFYQEEALSLLEGVYYERGVGIVNCTSKAPDVLDALTLYSTWLNMRFADSGRNEDLQAAMHWAEYIIQPNCEVDGASNLRRISCFVSCLLQKFHVYGRIEDINRVVSLDLVSNPHPRFAYDTGRVLMTAYERFRDKSYLDQAVSCLTTAVQHVGLQQDALSNFEAVFKRHLGYHDIIATQELFDLSPSRMTINVEQRPHALALPRAFLDWVQISSRYNSLGRALTMRYEVSQIREDNVIKMAIEHHQKALKLTPDTSHLYPQYLLCLGISHRVRFQVCNNKDDIEMAITLQREALGKAPQQHPYRIQYLRALAHSLFQRSLLSQEVKDFDEGLNHVREAVGSHYGFPHDRLAAAVLWASLFHHSDGARQIQEYQSSLTYPVDQTALLRCALEGYDKAISLLGQVTSIGISSSSRLAQLFTVPRGLASDAAACAFSLSERDASKSSIYLGKAVELLDQGRTILWSQAAQLQADLDVLREQQPEIAQELQRVSEELKDAAFGSETADNAGSVTSELVDKWEKLVNRVRTVPGFQDFLRPVPFKKLRQAAALVPVVIVNISDFRCDALIILSGREPEVVQLKKLRKSKVEDDVADLLNLLELQPCSDRRKFENILDRLWQNVGIPVLKALHKMGVDFTKPPHIRWCPTGRLAFLPIHAACPMRGSDRRGMLDRVVSSYIPTLSTLLRTKDIFMQFNMPRNAQYPRIAAVYCSDPVSQHGFGPLQFAKKEISVLKKHARTHVLDLALGSTSQLDAVLSALQNVDWVHFACHGIQDIMSPLESALILGDERIPVSRLARGEKLGGDFAMLLACETAKGSPGLSDEAIHVAAGLHFAGFKGVIATMWTIHDETGPDVANSVYEYLFSVDGEATDRRRPASEKAPYALRRALITLRDEKRMPALEWAPFIHYGI